MCAVYRAIGNVIPLHMGVISSTTQPAIMLTQFNGKSVAYDIVRRCRKIRKAIAFVYKNFFLPFCEKRRICSDGKPYAEKLCPSYSASLYAHAYYALFCFRSRCSMYKLAAKIIAAPAQTGQPGITAHIAISNILAQIIPV